MPDIPVEIAKAKPLEVVDGSDHLSKEDAEAVADALHQLVEQSSGVEGAGVGTGQDAFDVRIGALAPYHELWSVPLVHQLVPWLEELARKYHWGNYVLVRATGERVFESMPVFTRLGMHLLYYGKIQLKFLHIPYVQKVLQDVSLRQGAIYDSAQSTKSIPSFIKTYSISLDDLEEPDITKYQCFNSFFYRKLKPGARPVQDADDQSGFCSAADSRLTVYPSVSAARQFWIKGRRFSIPTLLGVKPHSNKARMFMRGSVAIFRLAPQDYHRFHSPIDGIVGEVHDIPGQYYTVNPQAVNEPAFDVFTENKRSVLYMTHARSGAPVAVVAIGAMLVGSILWTAGAQKGAAVKRGDELGYFAYGGSTVVALFPPGVIYFDEDLLENSVLPIETLVRVGDSLGKSVLADGEAFDPEPVLRAADAKLAATSADGLFGVLKRMAVRLGEHR